MFNNDTIFTLDSEEIALVTRHHTKENKLVFAVMLKFFQLEGRYPTSNDIIDQTMINHIALQLNLNSSIINFSNYDWSSRTIKRFRQEIRLLLGYNKPTIADSRKLIVWLIEHILPQASTLAQISEHASKFYRQNHLESHKPLQLERYIATACHKFEQQFWQDIFQELSTETIKSIDLLLNVNDTALVEDEEPTNFEISKGLEQIKLHELKKDIAGAKLKNITYAIDKLKRLRMLNLSDRLNLITRKLKQKYYLRICAELPSNIIEHPPVIRYAMMAIFCHFREQLITDNLVSSLIQFIHKIRTSAEMSVNKDILSEVKCVNGKFDILYILANTSVEHPKGVIDDTIYPKISKETLQTLAKELICNKGRWYQQQVQRKMHSLYSYAHRRVLLTLLEVFTFQTNNHDYEAVLSAIEFIKTNKNIKDKYYPDSKLVPAIDLIPIKWQVLVVEEVENNSGQYVTKVNRINYEVAILEELHSLLSSKQIWVTGTYHYRNPEEDLPKDFDSNREYYYQKLGLPIDSNAFVQKLQDNLTESVQQFNNSIIHNKKVKIVCNKKDKSGQIKLTPYTAQLLPPNLLTIQQIINKNWSTVNLIDILKETDLRVGFTKHFHTVASRENINEQKLLKRLLLALYAIGSNTGLKRISAANDDISYTDLRYIKRRFLNTANVRVAITEVVNAIINIRDPRIWGTATTGCACDSTKVSSWDQNLMTEWHNRYKGRGVMIYWHVDKNAICIYSQLKTCSSSEVASMIKGVLDHCCKMDLQKTYVDTHGQSTIGFGFSYLLDLDLLARLKNIKKQKLFYSHQKDRGNYNNLTPILKSAINWEMILLAAELRGIYSKSFNWYITKQSFGELNPKRLIKKYYNEVVRYVAALKIGTVEPEIMFKILSSNNNNHPVYKALTEIGNAVKTIFLCRYLMSEELRIEIHEALNVVENLNSIMGFIFYGKLGEISTNNKEDQELAIVCLHLLQVSMVYINTLMIQEVLSEPLWQNKLTKEDKRALTPLIHSHINPYGLFPLDLEKRIIIGQNNYRVAA